MLSELIHVLEFVVAGLVLFLAFRLFTLPRAQQEDNPIEGLEKVVGQARADVEKITDTTIRYEDRMDSLKMSQAFVSRQMSDVRERVEVLSTEQFQSLTEAMSLYIIGAVDFIARHTECDVKCRKELIQLVLKSNLRLSLKNPNAYLSEVVGRAYKEGNENRLRSGAKAAKSWLKEKTVPEGVSLDEQLSDWGILA